MVEWPLALQKVFHRVSSHEDLSNAVCLAFVLTTTLAVSRATAEDGFTSLFNGKDFTGWKVPEGDNGHWKIIDGVIDYDGESEAAGDKHLWTEKSYKNFTVKVDWRIKDTPYMNHRVCRSSASTVPTSSMRAANRSRSAFPTATRAFSSAAR